MAMWIISFSMKYDVGEPLRNRFEYLIFIHIEEEAYCITNKKKSKKQNRWNLNKPKTLRFTCENRNDMPTIKQLSSDVSFIFQAWFMLKFDKNRLGWLFHRWKSERILSIHKQNRHSFMLICSNNWMMFLELILLRIFNDITEMLCSDLIMVDTFNECKLLQIIISVFLSFSEYISQ